MRADTLTYLARAGSSGVFRGECLTEFDPRLFIFCRLWSPEAVRFCVVFELNALVGRRYEYYCEPMLFLYFSVSAPRPLFLISRGFALRPALLLARTLAVAYYYAGVSKWRSCAPTASSVNIRTSEVF